MRPSCNSHNLTQVFRSVPLALAVILITVISAHGAPRELVARGAYLARIAGCVGCHTPRHQGRIVESRLMSGGDHPIPGNLGRYYPPNITPDAATGIAGWSSMDIAKAIRTGVTPDGRFLSTAMPWRTQFYAMTEADAVAVADYLKSLPAIRSSVPKPLPKSQSIK